MTSTYETIAVQADWNKMLPMYKHCSPEKAQGLGRWDILQRRYFKLQVQKLHPVTFAGDTSYSLVLLSGFSNGFVRSALLDGLFQLRFFPQLQAQSLKSQLGVIGFCHWGWSQSQDLELPVWADLSLSIRPASPRASFLQTALPCLHSLVYQVAAGRTEEHANVTISK